MKSIFCLANCAGTPHSSGVCGVGLAVLNFCILKSILWTVLVFHGTENSASFVAEFLISVYIIIISHVSFWNTFFSFYHSFLSFYSAFTRANMTIRAFLSFIINMNFKNIDITISIINQYKIPSRLFSNISHRYMTLHIFSHYIKTCI